MLSPLNPWAELPRGVSHAKQFIYFPPSAYASKDDIPILTGEINGETFISYETKVFVPNVAPYSYSFVFTILKGK